MKLIGYWCLQQWRRPECLLWELKESFVEFGYRTNKMSGAGLLGLVAASWKWSASMVSQAFMARTSLLHQAVTYQEIRSMATLNQMHRKGRPKVAQPKLGPTFGCPQLKGVVLKTMIRKPKKPNSANRKCARVRLSNGKEVIVFIPGEGHNLQEHNIVLVEGGRTQDLPGVKLKVVRGKYDCAHVQKKK